MLIDLAENRDQGYISLKDIAERQSISRKYLEQIVQLLNKTDMLKTSRGTMADTCLQKTLQNTE